MGPLQRDRSFPWFHVEQLVFDLQALANWARREGFEPFLGERAAELRALLVEWSGSSRPTSRLANRDQERVLGGMAPQISLKAQRDLFAVPEDARLTARTSWLTLRKRRRCITPAVLHVEL